MSVAPIWGIKSGFRLHGIISRWEGALLPQSLTQWPIDCSWHLTAKPGEESQPNKLVQRVLKRMVGYKFVKKEGRRHVLTKEGKGAAESTPKSYRQREDTIGVRQQCPIVSKSYRDTQLFLDTRRYEITQKGEL
jgi:hypothetical protein